MRALSLRRKGWRLSPPLNRRAVPAAPAERLTKSEKCASSEQSPAQPTTPSRKQSQSDRNRNEKSEPGASFSGGQGAGSPPRLDTSVKGYVTGLNHCASADSPTNGKGISAAAGLGSKPRSRLARPVFASEAVWRRKYAAALRDLGQRKTAEAVEACCEVAASYSCTSCGEKHAHVELQPSCGARGCVHCARVQARDRRSRLLPALEKVPEYFAARRSQLHQEAQQKWQKAFERCEQLKLQIARGIEAGKDTRRLEKLLAKKDAERRRVGFQAARLGPKNKAGELEAWGWRFLTISPPWDPKNSEEMTVRGLRRRYEAVVRRWQGLRRALGDAVSAVVSVELNEAGFVHLHALVFCSEFLAPEWLQKVCGCFVKLKALKPAPGQRTPLDSAKSALVEGVKYTIKNKSPLFGAWIAGEKQEVTHYEAAARWTVAVKNRQLGRVYGSILRDAMAATKDAKPELPPPSGRSCWACSAEVSTAPTFIPPAVIARELGRNWSAAVHWVRWKPKAPA